MEILRTRALRGPNLWSRKTAMLVTVHCTPEECDITRLPGLAQRLRALFPAIGTLTTEDGSPTSLAHVLQFAAAVLQQEAGVAIGFARTVPTNETGVYQVVVEYREEAVGRQAIDAALALIQAASGQAQAAFDGAAMINGLRELDEHERLGPSTGSIAQAALARGIPLRRLTRGSLVQFGWGSRQRRIQAAEVDATSTVAESIAQDKELTKKLLLAAGVPVPLGRPVASLDEAWQVAQEVGLPVVAKPQDGNQGKGVTVNIQTFAELEAAYLAAEKYGVVMVEKYLPGQDYRLLVVGNRLAAAARREPPQVIGDGQHSVRELVDTVNLDPRRSDGHATSLTRIRLDDIALGQLQLQGLTPESVPEPGRKVVLRHNANLSTGGSATDVTDSVHPAVAASAVAAAQMVGLDICGVDVVCESVERPLEEQAGGVVEVNAAPGLRMHLAPSFGQPRPIGKYVVDMLFEKGNDGRIPLVSVTGTNGKTTTARLIAHLLMAHGLTTGMTNTDGIYINGRQIESGDCSGPRSARNVLFHPLVDAAVLEVARGGILREGLGFDQSQVAVVTNIGEGDHLGLNYIDTVQELAQVKAVTVRNVSPKGYAVLNAEDPLVAAMASATPGKVIYFAMDKHHPILAAHRSQGRRSVFVEGEAIVATEGAWRDSIPLAEIPITQHGRIGFQVQNVMAAVAAAWAVGLPAQTIRRGLASFVNDTDNAPGRFNTLQINGATVVADYGHNPDAMRALVQVVQATPAGKRVLVISAAGDRRDEDIRAQTSILATAFDEAFLYQDAAQRGRAHGEVLALLREGFERMRNQPGYRIRHLEEIQGEMRAIDAAIARLQPGDFCLVLIDQVEQALAHLRRLAAL
ncbi:cyanophycin synthetase [Vandammella animalimorsus]|uniref:Cyanophycin synthetase n=1 Tax=Vandammella animalimorsus TaxID=2029117 RepID=A0A2A2T9N3_9BURK|nr:cyanophycin synthetase [Vandammella animalimorsus]PAT33252.1 cyanophycin synthetase [Vandammella animalimorsus]PAX18511.1 cyanophycin synthetase [Vandammella animalimorsus]PAX20674.1 cyanophycin synthetase [Vandammella animalimorsus]